MPDVVTVNYPALTHTSITRNLHNKAPVAPGLHVHGRSEELHAVRYRAFWDFFGTLLKQFTFTLLHAGPRQIGPAEIGVDHRLQGFFAARGFIFLLGGQELINKLRPGLVSSCRTFHPEGGNTGTTPITANLALTVDGLPVPEPDTFHVKRTLHVRCDPAFTGRALKKRRFAGKHRIAAVAVSGHIVHFRLEIFAAMRAWPVKTTAVTTVIER